MHGCYRALRALLRWWEQEYEPDNWRNPIRKVQGPKVSADPLPPADLAEARFWGAGVGEANSSVAIHAEIRRQLQERGDTTKTRLAEFVKGSLVDIGKNRIRDEIEAAAQQGLIEIKDMGDGKPKICRLPS